MEFVVQLLEFDVLYDPVSSSFVLVHHSGDMEGIEGINDEVTDGTWRGHVWTWMRYGMEATRRLCVSGRKGEWAEEGRERERARTRRIRMRLVRMLRRNATLTLFSRQSLSYRRWPLDDRTLNASSILSLLYSSNSISSYVTLPCSSLKCAKLLDGEVLEGL